MIVNLNSSHEPSESTISNKKAGRTMPQNIPKKERAMGALMGRFIGEALGTGCRWYYDIDEKIKEYGPWVSDYVTPKTDHYHCNLKAGDIASAGITCLELIDSLIAYNGYNENDYTERLDTMFETMDRGSDARNLWNDRNTRHVLKQRRAGVDWDKIVSLCVSSEAALRSVSIAARYHGDPARCAKNAHHMITLTHTDPFIAAQSLAFALDVCSVINGIPMWENQDARYQWASYVEGVLPTFTDAISCSERFWSIANNPAIKIEPAWQICQVYGLNCQQEGLVSSAYYLVSRFPDEFEMPVLSALNGGGNNLNRAALTGALSGAMVGLQGIPDRFIQGLTDHEHILELVDKLTDQAEGDPND
jgi:ADP-ribosyl-[dinitrogen reductase] hydrolase